MTLTNGGPKYLYYCRGDNDGTKTGTRQVLSGYDLNCGKTTSTVENYKISY